MAKRAAPRKDDDFALFLGAGLLSAGLVGMIYLNNEQRREAFLERLATGLRAYGLEFVSATFGRAVGNLPVWRVTLRTLDGGVRTQRVELPAGTEPYADATCQVIVEHVVAHSS